ncbi:Gfo/Idh/MocA family oxidoreductase [Paenibacillus sp. CC-CFT747]|nr:Gfo/Idh/MocA family oxidoreductase [Paenibacillus sp. CC-CFT747]
MIQPLRFILVGLGTMGSVWCRQTVPYLTGSLGAEFTAAVDPNEASHRHAIEAGLSPDRCYTDLRSALQQHNSDFVISVVPPALHEGIVDLALEFGCDILSEKPIADTLEASCRIFQKVKAAGRKMAVTMSHRFDQDKQTLERLIHSGKYGAVDSIIGRFSADFRRFASWGKFRHEMDYPLLVEGAIHHFDILRSLAGSNPKTLYAKSWKADWGQYTGDSNTMVICEMENGVKTFFEGSKTSAATTNSWSQEYFRAECDKATLELSRRRSRPEARWASLSGAGSDPFGQTNGMDQYVACGVVCRLAEGRKHPSEQSGG